MIRTRPWRALLAFGLPALWLALVTTWELTCPMATDDAMGVRIGLCAAFLIAAVYLCASVRIGSVRELKLAREVAHATQQALLRPLPARIEGLAVAAGQLSASPGATVGGDLYEAVSTVHGVRIVIGDVRGHGLPAIGAVAALLGSFREAAHDEPELGGVMRRLERALERHLRERSRAEHPASGGADPENPLAEEFVTVLLIEIGAAGELRAVNCGHPWPYRLAGRARQLSAADPLPPLGPFPLPAAIALQQCGRLLPGEALLLHTDGAADARDSRGRFFPLEEVLGAAALDSPVSPAEVIDRVHRALRRHTGGRLSDDVALLVLRNDRSRIPAQPGAVQSVRARG
ncbi:PP2C family protein-serine/threonine phosphatase [Streptomyces sp. NPDC050738]|uniref:PP2C family protein-serine/threonine phosphatase n=1 Tax=Streptomyces sp. NPDC050738 TaxID=3154744 RepID=UPI0034329574